MKILHLSNGDLTGGAARGSYWLHRGLQNFGVESQILVKDKISDDSSVLSYEGSLEKYLDKVRGTVDQVFLMPYSQRKKSIFSPAKIGKNVHKRINEINPDIINLHWVCGGFLSIEEIGKIAQIAPLLWTVRDMWALTGGCHYTEGCEKYYSNCGACPHLGSSQEVDLSRRIWQRKNKSWRGIDLTIVAISEWLADCARNSSLFNNHRVEVIHNALDENKYKPLDKKFARDVLGLPQDKQIILFGAISAIKDKRKGFDYLLEALKKIDPTHQDQVELVVFGASQGDNSLGLQMKTHFFGRLYDDVTLALIYSAGDVMIVPSLQEAFGKTAMESLACGTPVVSFNSTGLKDIVDHQKNGYRAQCFSADDLAHGITWVLEDEGRWNELSKSARQTVLDKFTLKIQAQKYLELYQDVIANHRSQ